MAFYPWNSQVTIRGMRGKPPRPHFARSIKVQIELMDAPMAISQDQAAARWRYQIRWDPKDTLDDGSRISEGDVLLWEDVYPGQELTISEVFFDPGVTLNNITGYFMPVDTSGPNAA